MCSSFFSSLYFFNRLVFRQFLDLIWFILTFFLYLFWVFSSTFLVDSIGFSNLWFFRLVWLIFNFLASYFQRDFFGLFFFIAAHHSHESDLSRHEHGAAAVGADALGRADVQSAGLDAAHDGRRRCGPDASDGIPSAALAVHGCLHAADGPGARATATAASGGTAVVPAADGQQRIYAAESPAECRRNGRFFPVSSYSGAPGKVGWLVGRANGRASAATSGWAGPGNSAAKGAGTSGGLWVWVLMQLLDWLVDCSIYVLLVWLINSIAWRGLIDWLIAAWWISVHNLFV